MDTIIYTYGGGEVLWKVFNGLSIIFKNDSPYYTNFFSLSLLIGGIWGATSAMFQGNVGVFAKSWFIPTYALLSLVLIPKVSVKIVDEVDHRFRAIKVDNIPAGLAVVSSLSSQLMHVLTEQIEDVFPTHDSLKYVKVGPIFASRLLSQSSQIRIKDPIQRQNLKNFARQCFWWPYVATNLKGLRAEALKTNDILGFVKNSPHEWLGVYWKDKDGSTRFVDCKKCCAEVEKLLLFETPQTLSFLEETLFGKSSSNTEFFTSNLKNQMSDAWAQIAHHTSSATDALGQQMLINAYRESLDDKREEFGRDRLHPELLSLSAARSQAQQNTSFLVKGSIATTWVPTLQAVLFSMILIMFVIVLPLAFLPGGISLFAMWIKLIFWVQTWPVLSAVLSAICYMMQQRASATIVMTGGDGFTLETTSALADAAYDAACWMSGLQLSVPFIAWAFINKGGEYAISNLASMVTGSVDGYASKLGA